MSFESIIRVYGFHVSDIWKHDGFESFPSEAACRIKVGPAQAISVPDLLLPTQINPKHKNKKY